MNYAKDFPLFKKQPKLIYFDNAATVLKPESVIQKELDYLINNGANTHTLDFKNALIAEEMIAETRQKLATFLHAMDSEEFIFTSGATHSLNQVAFGLKHWLKPGDEILTTALEHAANLLPWIVIANETQAKVSLVKLTPENTLDLNDLKQKITPKTKLLTFAHGSNTIGVLNNVAQISQVVRQINPEIIIVVDVAQTIGHHAIDLKKWDVDFVAFSAHKMYGPFGLGILWGKKVQLELLKPLIYGGGMSLEINEDLKTYELTALPGRLEGGTLNIPGIMGLNAALDYLTQIGMKEIETYESELKKYAIQRIKELNLTATIDFYNLNNDTPLLVFNAKKWNPQDVAYFLDQKYQIAVRSGAHCARLTQLAYGCKYSVRASFAIYNTKAEIDTLLMALQDVDNSLDVLSWH